jgi:hypothetical protein
MIEKFRNFAMVKAAEEYRESIIRSTDKAKKIITKKLEDRLKEE